MPGAADYWPHLEQLTRQPPTDAVTVPPLTESERTTLRRMEAIARAWQDAAPSADGAVLMGLAGHPQGRRGMTDLMRALSWEKSRLSHHLTRMERRGLVVREQCPDDLRAWFVSLTEAGRAAAASAQDAHTVAARNALALMRA